MINQKKDLFMRNFYYSALTQHSNAGDALINRELVKFMREYGGIHCYVGSSPKSFIHEINLKKQEIFSGNMIKFFFHMIYKRFKGEEVFLVQTPGDIAARKNSLSDFIKTALIILLYLLGIKVIHVGISLGEFTKLQGFNFRLRSRFMHVIGLRDNLSLEKSKRMNLKNCSYFPDLAFSVFPCYKEKNQKLKIGLSFRNDNLDLNKQQHILNNLQKKLAEINDENTEIFIIVQVERDLNFAKKIKLELSNFNCDIFEEYSLNKLSDFYKNLDYVVSNRLHVILLSGLNGALPIAYVDLETNSKIIGLFNSLDLNFILQYQYNDLDINIYSEGFIKFKQVAELQNQKINKIFADIVS